MYLCYADDSGADRARTVTGLLVEAPHWSDLLGVWLEARDRLAKEWGVEKSAELHAVQLAKSRGRFCGADVEAEERFRSGAVRLAAYRTMLNTLARFAPLTITTVGAPSRFQVDVYGHFLDHIDAWAAANDTHVLVVYDGKGVGDVGGGHDQGLEVEQVAEKAWRDQQPYRLKHRSLDLRSRRIVEDVFVQDSTSSQLVQAADLVAYAAYQHRLTTHPDTWPGVRPIEKVAQAYGRLADRWVPGVEDGIVWVDPVQRKSPRR